MVSGHLVPDSPFSNSFWDMVVSEMPQALLKDVQILLLPAAQWSCPYILPCHGIHIICTLSCSFSLTVNSWQSQTNSGLIWWFLGNIIPLCSSVTSSTVHTNATETLYVHLLFSTTCLGLMYWPSTGRKIQVQKEECYRRGLPFTISC